MSEQVEVRKGDQFRAMGCEILVVRVAKSGEWADLRVSQERASWGKRQRLPFPADWEQVARNERDE